MNIQPPKKFKILVVGDSCVDIYQFGTVDRISPEAPIPVFVPTTQYSRPGMANNVAENLLALGCEVDLITGLASEKTRLIDQRSKQQVLRIDRDVVSTACEFDIDLCKNFDAVVVSDYNKGSVTDELLAGIVAKSPGPVFVDTKKTDLARLRGAWVKINELEYSKVISDCPGLIVTRGAAGAEIVHHGIVCAAPQVEVVDVTGAGDTFLSALCFAALSTANIKSAVEFAIQAAAVTVQHLGVYAPKLEELQ